mgnify:CR=1 FL=1
MEAVVLAGGFGTRLKGCIDNIPKPLAPVNGKPFLLYLLDYLYANGVHRAIISTGYLAEKVEQAIGNRYRGMTVEYSVEDTPLGTGGGIKKALRKCTDDNVIVCNGDSFFDVDLFGMRRFHLDSGYPVTLAAKFIENAHRSGLLEFSNGKLCGFTENGIAPSGFINGGVYFINRTLLESIDEDKFSFEKSVLAGPFDIGVYESSGYFIDIGVPESYELANKESRKLISHRKRCAVFVDRDGTINKDTVHLFRKEEFEFLPDADRAIAMLKKMGYLVTVITNQAGVAKGLYGEEDVHILHSYVDSLLSEKYSVVADGYYYCPHHPEATVEEYRAHCPCRKPEAGLILRAIEDYAETGIEIDLSKSYTIGNRISDILAGKNAGVEHNILVGNDEKDDFGVASEAYGSLYKAVNNIKQVF